MCLPCHDRWSFPPGLTHPGYRVAHEGTGIRFIALKRKRRTLVSGVWSYAPLWQHQAATLLRVCGCTCSGRVLRNCLSVKNVAFRARPKCVPNLAPAVSSGVGGSSGKRTNYFTVACTAYIVNGFQQQGAKPAGSKGSLIRI